MDGEIFLKLLFHEKKTSFPRPLGVRRISGAYLASENERWVRPAVEAGR